VAARRPGRGARRGDGCRIARVLTVAAGRAVRGQGQRSLLPAKLPLGPRKGSPCQGRALARREAVCLDTGARAVSCAVLPDATHRPTRCAGSGSPGCPVVKVAATGVRWCRLSCCAPLRSTERPDTGLYWPVRKAAPQVTVSWLTLSSNPGAPN